MTNETFKNLEPTMAELALIAALRQNDVAVSSPEAANEMAEQLSGIQLDNLVTVSQHDANLIGLLANHEVPLNELTIEAMSYLLELDPEQVSHFLTFYICELARAIELEDKYFFCTDGVQAMLRLQQFLIHWKTAWHKQELEMNLEDMRNHTIQKV